MLSEEILVANTAKVNNCRCEEFLACPERSRMGRGNTVQHAQLSDSARIARALAASHSDRVYPDGDRERNLGFSRLRGEADRVNLRSLRYGRDDEVVC